MLKKFNRILFVLSLVLTMGTVLSAQVSSENIRPKINSPISRFGLGNLSNPYFTAAGSMGGYSAAFVDPFHINLENPASLSFLRATAFEVGMDAKVTALEGSNGQSDNFIGGNLNYLALGFPIKNPLNQALDRVNSPWQFGMAISLTPYSSVGYDITTYSGNDESGSVLNILKGTGGTYRFNWGGGARFKNFSAGISLNYHFGQIINSRLVAFDTLAYSYFTEFRDDMTVNALVLNVGIQYVHEFKSTNDDGKKTPNGKRIIVGVYGNNETNFTTFNTSFIKRENVFSNFGSLDSISYQADIEGSGILPTDITFGIAYEQLNKFRVGVDFNQSNWSNYVNTVKPDALSDSWRLSIGGEYIPDIISYNNYFQRIRYRGGFFTGTDPRSIQGQQLKFSGLTLGFGLPIIMPRQMVSFVDIGFEFGQYGVKNILTEKYFNFTLGLTLNDNSWFFKRKFN